MPFIAEVHRVMIASPSDVIDERVAVREMLHSWNDVHSEFRKLVLLPVGWETSTTPAMGNHPQEIINSQILGDADILIGIFWTRLGSSTTEYRSGTVEEIERHIAAGKTAKLYFSDSPVHPGSVNPLQYEALQAFKADCQKRGLLETYSGINDFRAKFERHIQLEMNREIYIRSAHSAERLQKVGLSSEATSLLCAAVADRYGNIVHSKDFSGEEIGASGQNFIQEQSPRNVALWNSALEELISLGLIKDLGHRGEIFVVTEKGYQAVEDFHASKKFQVDLCIEGNPPTQSIALNSTRPLLVTRVGYTLGDGGPSVATEDVKLHGEKVNIPINQDLLTTLWNAPRPNRAHHNNAGPAGLTVTVMDGQVKRELALPVLLDYLFAGNTMFRRVVGSISISY